MMSQSAEERASARSDERSSDVQRSASPKIARGPAQVGAPGSSSALRVGLGARPPPRFRARRSSIWEMIEPMTRRFHQFRTGDLSPRSASAPGSASSGSALCLGLGFGLGARPRRSASALCLARWGIVQPEFAHGDAIRRRAGGMSSLLHESASPDPIRSPATSRSTNLPPRRRSTLVNTLSWERESDARAVHESPSSCSSRRESEISGAREGCESRNLGGMNDVAERPARARKGEMRERACWSGSVRDDVEAW